MYRYIAFHLLLIIHHDERLSLPNWSNATSPCEAITAVL